MCLLLSSVPIYSIHVFQLWKIGWLHRWSMALARHSRSDRLFARKENLIRPDGMFSEVNQALHWPLVLGRLMSKPTEFAIVFDEPYRLQQQFPCHRLRCVLAAALQSHPVDFEFNHRLFVWRNLIHNRSSDRTTALYKEIHSARTIKNNTNEGQFLLVDWLVGWCVFFVWWMWCGWNESNRNRNAWWRSKQKVKERERENRKLNENIRREQQRQHRYLLPVHMYKRYLRKRKKEHKVRTFWCIYDGIPFKNNKNISNSNL